MVQENDHMHEMFGKTVGIRHCPATVSATLRVLLDEMRGGMPDLKATGEI